MATTIITKYGSGAPTASDVVRGELAVDTENKRLYTEDSGGSVVELGTNPAAAVTFNNDVTFTGTSYNAVWDSSDNALEFANNAKATFGDDSDLQISHDGSHSKIQDTGTGDLKIQASNLLLEAQDGTNYIYAVDGTAVRIYHPDATNGIKLATTSTGIDVTGTVTADALTVDTDTLVVDAANNRVGIGTTSPAEVLNVKTSAGNSYVDVERATQAQGEVGLKISGGTSGTDWFIYQPASSNDLRFYKTGDKVTIDDSGNVGIGTTSPGSFQAGAENLVIGSGSGDEGMTIYSGIANRGNIYFADGTTGADLYKGQINYFHDSDYMRFVTAGTERLRIDANGNVGIGSSSPTFTTGSGLEIQRTTATATLRLEYTGSNGYEISAEQNQVTYNSVSSKPHVFEIGSVEKVRIDSTGNLLVGRTSRLTSQVESISSDTVVSAHGDLTSHQTSTVVLQYNSTDNIGMLRAYGATAGTGQLRFNVGGGGGSTDFEAVRIDSSGNLLVGKTSGNAIGTAGIEIDGNNNRIMATRDGNEPLLVNRLNSDGALIDLKKDGTTVGSITADNGYLGIGKGDTGLIFQDANDAIQPRDHTGLVNRDGAIDLGVSGGRFKDLYRSGSTISTSDRNMKQDERDLTEAETRVAQACKSLLKAFRFIDAVEVDGDNARIHFGIIAQDLQAAFEAEGLDATKYAMFRPGTYTDDEGNEQTRLGVCYENLLAFIIAAI